MLVAHGRDFRTDQRLKRPMLSIRIGEDRESHALHRLASPTALRHILLEAAEGGSLTASSFTRD